MRSIFLKFCSLSINIYIYMILTKRSPLRMSWLLHDNLEQLSQSAASFSLIHVYLYYDKSILMFAMINLFAAFHSRIVVKFRRAIRLYIRVKNTWNDESYIVFQFPGCVRDRSTARYGAFSNELSIIWNQTLKNFKNYKYSLLKRLLYNYILTLFFPQISFKTSKTNRRMNVPMLACNSIILNIICRTV